MEDENKMKNKSNLDNLTFKCMCGCGSKVMFQRDKEDSLLHIDVKERGKQERWQGVVLEKKEIELLKDFLKRGK